MPDIPYDDISQLWDTADHSWEGFKAALASMVGSPEGIENNTTTALIKAIDALEKLGTPFPSDPITLSNLIDQQLKSQP